MSYHRSQSAAFDPFGLADKKKRQSQPRVHQCEHPGCTAEGTFRAPRDRRLTEYMWLCLEHVRQHNQNWDFYEGMSAAEVEKEIRRDSCWQRPTWILGAQGLGRVGGEAQVHDRLGIFARDKKGADAKRRRDSANYRSHRETQGEKATRILDIEPPFTREDLRTRYLRLVKLHHPDVNQGNPLAEERLKEINEAYTFLVKALNT